MLPVIITTHIITVYALCGRHKKGRGGGGGGKVKKPSPPPQPPPLFPFLPIPYPFLPTPATQACIAHVPQRLIGSLTVKKILL